MKIDTTYPFTEKNRSFFPHLLLKSWMNIQLYDFEEKLARS